jgi:hypothetical protein
MINDFVVANNSITRQVSGTLLDHVLLRSNTDALIFTSKNYKLSDHNFVALLKKITLKVNFVHKTISKLNQERLKQSIDDTDFISMVNPRQNVQVAFTQVINSIKTAMDDARMTFKVKHKFEYDVPPFVDEKYIKLTNNINNLHDKIHKRSNNDLPVNILVKRMTELEKKLTQHTQMRAKSYYSGIIANNKSFS